MDTIRQVGIKDNTTVNEDKTKVEGDAKPKGRCFQQSTFNREEISKATKCGLEYKVFNFRK